MGNRFSRRRDAPVTSAEAVATEQKAAEEPAAAQPAEDPAITQTQEATEDLDVVVGEQVSLKVCLPSEECVSECKEVEAPVAPVSDLEPEPAVKETPAPVQPEPLVIDSTPAPPEPEPVVEAPPAPEPAPEPEPVPEPESAPVPESAAVPEPDPVPEADAEADPEAIPEPEPAPAEPVEQQTDLLSQESLPEPVLPSPTLIDFAVPDATPSPAPTPVSPDEPADVPAGEQCQDSTEAAENSTFEPEQPAETSEVLEKLVEVEAPECLEKLGSDVNEESVCEILKNLELKGNDLVNDLIPSDVKIPDDTPIIDMSTSSELM